VATLKGRLRYALWAVGARFGPRVSARTPASATVVITYFQPVRMAQARLQIRSVLRCRFVERLVVSNHNPTVALEALVGVRDPRLLYLQQDVARACGFRWRVAAGLDAEYLIVLDDDVLPSPSQLKLLFERLVAEPGVPHGLCGQRRRDDGGFEYREREETDVHHLCEVYAVTRTHVARYATFVDRLAGIDESLPDLVERLGDHVVISQTGSGAPAIHRAGRMHRSATFKTPGIANHKDGAFGAAVARVVRAMDDLRSRDGAR
jgi:hypothetical protein